MESERHAADDGQTGDVFTRPDISWKWDEAEYNPGWHEPTAAVLQRHVPRNSRILEVGAGGSYALPALVKSNGCTAFGVEPDEEGVNKTRAFARANSVSVSLVRGDGFAIPFADETFDVVYSQGLIEHFQAAASSALLTEHRRVCREGGIVIVSVPNVWNLPHTLRKGLLGKRYEYHPERSYTTSNLGKLLERCNLRIIGVDGVLPLWVLGGVPGWWRVLVILERLRLLQRINNFKRPKWRARWGYMTYAVARKEPDGEKRG